MMLTIRVIKIDRYIDNSQGYKEIMCGVGSIYNIIYFKVLMGFNIGYWF